MVVAKNSTDFSYSFPFYLYLKGWGCHTSEDKILRLFALLTNIL